MSRETDAAVATEVMGEPRPEGKPTVTGHISTLTMFEDYPWKAWVPRLVEGRPDWTWAPRSYSTLIADAWLVVEKLAERIKDMGFSVEFVKPEGWFAKVWDHGIEAEWEGPYADTAPEAICLAALEAVRAEP